MFRNLYCLSHLANPSWRWQITQLRSSAAFIHFTDTVCFCLSALPPARSIAKKIRFRFFARDHILGVSVSGFACSSAGPSWSGKCLRIIITSRCWLSRFFAVLQREVFSFSDATGCEQRLFRWPISFSWFRCRTRWQNALETASKYASAEVANVLFHLSGMPFLREGLYFPIAQHHGSKLHRSAVVFDQAGFF